MLGWGGLAWAESGEGVGGAEKRRQKKLLFRTEQSIFKALVPV